MSFFGITALGAPNNFTAGLVSALGLNVYTDEEFEVAFNKMDKDGSGAITVDEVEDLLHETYGFPPLEDEVTLFMQSFDLNGDGKVTWFEFKSTLNRLREKMAAKGKNAKEYQSWEKMRADRYKHIRMQTELQDKYKMPVTSSQAYGFLHKDEQQKEIIKMVGYPIHQCPETKYADEMIRTGFLFS